MPLRTFGRNEVEEPALRVCRCGVSLWSRCYGKGRTGGLKTLEGQCANWPEVRLRANC